VSTRDRVRALLLERPGLTTTEAARALALDRTTARYHLRQLARERHAVASGLRWFPPRQALGRRDSGLRALDSGLPASPEP
jgi:predicted transcriptional regulator